MFLLVFLIWAVAFIFKHIFGDHRTSHCPVCGISDPSPSLVISQFDHRCFLDNFTGDTNSFTRCRAQPGIELKLISMCYVGMLGIKHELPAWEARILPSRIDSPKLRHFGQIQFDHPGYQAYFWCASFYCFNW